MLCRLLSNAGRRCARLCCAILALAAGASQAAPFAYITNRGSANVSVIDTASDTVIATVGVGTQPWGVAVNPVRRRAYVANNGSSSVSVIDTDTQTVVATVGVGNMPTGVAVRPDGTRIYVTNFVNGSVSVIDADSNTVIHTVFLTPAAGPRGIAVLPDGTRAFVANESGHVSVVDLDTYSQLSTPQVSPGLLPFDVAVSLDGARVYVTLRGGCSVLIFNTLVGGVTTVPLLPSLCGGVVAAGIAVSPFDGVAYVAATISLRGISGTTLLSGGLAGGVPFGVGVHPVGPRLYGVNIGLNSVTVFDGGVVVANVPVGSNPSTIGKFVSPITSPSAPLIGSGTPGNGQATIAFDTPVSDGGRPITGYTATCNPGAFTAAGAASPLTLTGLANGTAYACSVTAVNAIGTSAASATVDVTPATVPGAPAIDISAPGNAQATVTITAPVSDGGAAIIGYTVVSNPAGGVDGDAGTLNTPRVVTGLANGTAYTFTVTATNAVGTSVASAPSNSVTPLAPPVVPGAPTAAMATAGNTQATVTFTAPASNGGSAITGYTVTSNPAGGVDGNAGTLSTNHIVTGLANGTTYTFTVTATNAIGASVASTPSNSVTPAGPPSAPTAAAATAGDAQATVAFTTPASNGGTAITGYTVVSNPAGGVDGNAGTTSTNHVITGLANGTAYTFRVTATNATGTSPPSAPSNSVTPSAPPGAPGAPTAVTATAGNAQATVTFTAPASNGGSAITGYTVSSSPAGGVDGNAGTTSTNHAVTGLTNGTVYVFTVTATNAIGTSAPSTASNSVKPIGLPGAPTIGAATPGNGQATIAFTPPASDGGSAILSYAATCNPGAISASGTAPSITVAGLANGTPYACSVAASNSVGAGLASATASVTPTHNVFSGASATGSGTVTVSFSGGGAACTFAPPGSGPMQSAFFIPVSGHAKSPPAGSAPGAVAFPHGLLDFVLLNCTPGSTMSFTVTYPTPLRAAMQYWKYGPTPSSATPHWYVLPATINGNSVTFSIVDGGLGDDDLAANGAVVDQGGPGDPGAGDGIRQVPTLSQWALMLLASLMLLGAMRHESLRRR